MHHSMLLGQPSKTRVSLVPLFWGYVVYHALSFGAHRLFEATGLYDVEFYPMWIGAMLTFFYTFVGIVVGSYVAARLAPHSPRHHAMVLGVIALVVFAGSAMWSAAEIDPNIVWYPIILCVIAVPSAWLGGYLYQRQAYSSSY